jgi:DNA polymerase-2
MRMGMVEYRGWFLDMYEDEEQDVRLWFLGEDGQRHCFYQSFPVTFYVTGSF